MTMTRQETTNRMRDMAYRWMDRAHEDGDPMLHERALGLKAKADQIDEQYKDIP